MAEKETKNKPKDLIEAVPEELSKIKIEGTEESVITEKPAEVEKIIKRMDKASEEQERARKAVAAWAPKTKLGKLVKEGSIKNIDEILSAGKKILEAEISESLLTLESDLLLVGQAKGKFGGGKRRAWRQTQKKTMEGNVVTFSCMAVVGDRQGHVVS